MLEATDLERFEQVNLRWLSFSNCEPGKVWESQFPFHGMVLAFLGSGLMLIARGGADGERRAEMLEEAGEFLLQPVKDELAFESWTVRLLELAEAGRGGLLRAS